MRSPFVLGAVGLGVVGLVSTGPLQAQQLDRENPINATVPTTDFTVELVDVIRIPNSSGQAPRLDLLTPAPTDDGRLVVNDQRGRVYAFTPGQVNPSLIFNAGSIPGFALSGFERGMRSFAFHPDFNQQGADGFGKAYVMYSTFDGSGPNVFDTPAGFGTDHYSALAEFDVNPETLVFDSNSRRDILKVAQPFGNHNVGQIAFKPGTTRGDGEHGLLYLGSGDGGSANDPVGAGQNNNTPLGKVLRIDPLQDGNDAYTVPPDNPFVDVPGLDEVWATGLRAPTRLAWDDESLGGDGRMFIHEIGQDSVEEINVGRPGANYGWGIREGTFAKSGTSIFTLPANHPTDIFSYPVAQYDHDFDNDGQKEDTVASIGGPVARGPALPQLDGHYVFADFANQSDGPIYVVPVEDLIERDDFTNLSSLSDGFLAPFRELRLTRDGVEIASFEALLQQTTGNPFQDRTDTRFGYDGNGGVYVLNKHDGWVRKLMAAPREATDFNFSGFSDVDDLDDLLAAFGIVNSDTAIYNLDTTGISSNRINNADLVAWLALTGNVNGDANLNGQVEQGDLDAVLQNWGSTAATNPQLGWGTGDLDGNGLVAQGDLDRVLQNWGGSAAPDFRGVDVPEPTAAAVLLGGVVLLRYRRA